MANNGSFGCDDLSFFVVIPAFTINIIASIVNVTIFFASCYFMYVADSKIKKTLKIIFVALEFAYVIGNVSSTIRVFAYAICPSTRYSLTTTESIIYWQMTKVYIVGYQLGLILLYYLFVFRAIHAFQDTIFEFSKSNKILLHLLGFSMILPLLLADILIIFVGEFGTNQIANVSFNLGYAMFVVGSIVVLFMFVNKFNNYRSWVISNKSNGSNTPTSVSRQDKIGLNLLLKILVCCGVATGTTIMSRVFFYFFFIIDNDYYPLIYFVLISIDIAANGLLIFLQWSFSDKLYNKWCGKCDTALKHPCKQLLQTNVDVKMNIATHKFDATLSNNNTNPN